MTEKYIDLAPLIASMHDQPLGTMRVVLGLLDEFASEHPDQVPGRTITESDLIAAVDETNHEDMNEYQKARALLVHLGHAVPTPWLTNFERLEDLVDKWRKGEPLKTLTQYLDDCGVKAPGGDDDH